MSKNYKKNEIFSEKFKKIGSFSKCFQIGLGLSKKKKSPKTGEFFKTANYLPQPQPLPKPDNKIKRSSVSQSMQICPPLKPPNPPPQPQFCKSKRRKIREQQSQPPLPEQPFPTSLQFEPPKKFICAS